MRIQLLISASVIFLACNAPDKPLPDNQENRLSMAKVVVKSYPTQSFREAVKNQIAETTGEAVVEDAGQLLRKSKSPEELEEKRVELLMKNFSAAELKTLAEIVSTPNGRSVITKLPEFNQDLTDYFSPYVLEALSNSDEAIQ